MLSTTTPPWIASLTSNQSNEVSEMSQDIYRLQVLYSYPEDPDHFEQYYRHTHLPLAAQLPGVLSARFSLSVATANEPSPYFAMFEADFASAADLASAMASEWGQKVEADVPNYASGGSIVLTYPVETLQLNPPT